MAEKEYIECEAAVNAVLNLAPKVDCDGYCWVIRGDAARAIDSIPAADVRPVEWIPVKERLPEEYETVLLLTMSGEVISGYYDSDYKSYCDMTGFRHLCTHWMPLPEPPKEET